MYNSRHKIFSGLVLGNLIKFITRKVGTHMISANDFLEKVYEQLDYKSGEGYYPVANPLNQPNLSQMSWFDQARQLGAETIFFVNDFPTVLFFKYDTQLDADTAQIEEDIHQLFLKVWNTSRVPLFFVALPGELRVYSAYQMPVKHDKWVKDEYWLKRIKTITDIAELMGFSRPQVESGQLFQENEKAFNRENRVDQWLLKNLRLLRQKLENSAGKNKREYVHALIGRSIFIRYLEDRKILTEEYFSDISTFTKYHSYLEVLSSKKDTYFLFEKLQKDFNGDLFPLSNEEKIAIEESDLHVLGEFLLGRSMGDQPDLLFWAYKFDIIPIELISNIYEEFYHEHSEKEDTGTHYTPTSLVDFMLSQTLTDERLGTQARVLDPACGSGIFLVEAFKRMVYYTRRQKGTDELSHIELTDFLTNQIVGFDTNKSAIQVAAFSLYLAFLDFRNPPNIQKNKRLPKLIYNTENPENGGGTLFHVNAFSLTGDEIAKLEEQNIDVSQYSILPLENHQFDIIIGNPPWGADNSLEGKKAVKWCQDFKYPIGDKELSQCFIWRMQHLLKQNGEIGLLVSTGIFFKQQKNSMDFRRQWLLHNNIRAVYNFTHVRQLFFQSAIAPFAIIFFTRTQQKENPSSKNKIFYTTIKSRAFIQQLQAVIMDKNDFLKINQSDFLANDWLWKTYMWGQANDVELIEELKNCSPSMGTIIENPSKNSSRGFSNFNGAYSTDDLLVSHELLDNDFDKNKPFSELIVPITFRKIYRVRKTNLYKGERLIIKRGISKSSPKYGEIQARLADIPFAFTDNFIGFQVDFLEKEKQQILLGIILSSLAKYYHFLTCAMWGLWKYKIDINEHLKLPVRFPEKDEYLKKRILNSVNNLENSVYEQTLFSPNRPDWSIIQNELDEAIFDLYELSEPQRDLVRDLCQVTLEFFYEGTKAKALKPPSLEELDNYKKAFLEIWQDRLAHKGKELEITIYAPHHGLLVGVVCELVDLGTAQNNKPITDNSSWQREFRRLGKLLRQEQTSQIYIDRTIKELTDSSILIIKRSERRLWTKSMARQDAQELLAQVFRLEWQQNGGVS